MLYHILTIIFFIGAIITINMLTQDKYHHISHQLRVGCVGCILAMFTVIFIPIIAYVIQSQKELIAEPEINIFAIVLLFIASGIMLVMKHRAKYRYLARPLTQGRYLCTAIIIVIIATPLLTYSLQLKDVSIDLPKTDTTVIYETTNHHVKPLITGVSSNTDKGAVKYGATMIMGDLDEYSRSTFSHIQLRNDQEPGNNGEKREERINVDPAGWRNFKLNGAWANNRCHLIGYQFSGLNDDLRNLSIGTSYLNKGTEGNGMDASNPDGMLFYEQRLDAWLEANPDYLLDLYVKPLYKNDSTTPYAYYMQWVGITPEGTTTPIEIEGHSVTAIQDIRCVTLDNQSPSYIVDTITGDITLK